MNLKPPRIHLILFLLFPLVMPLASHAEADLAGSWRVDPALSSAIDPLRRILLEIDLDGDALNIERTVTTGRRTSSQVYPLRIGETVDVPVEWWTGNRHIGAYIGGDGKETLKTEWIDGGDVLRVESHYTLASSQGETPVRSYYEYRLSPDGDELTVIELRSSRHLPIVHVFRRS